MQGQIDREVGADLGDDLGCKEGMSAEGEEVGLDANPLQPEDVRPDPGNSLLNRRPWRDVVAPSPRAATARAGSASRSTLPLCR